MKMSGAKKPSTARRRAPPSSRNWRHRHQVQRVGVEPSRRRAEDERQAQPREQIADHRVARAHPGPREQHARVVRVLRAQQVEARHHARASARPGSAAARWRRVVERGLAQRFLALSAICAKRRSNEVSAAQRLPDREERRPAPPGPRAGDQIVRTDASTAASLRFEICDLCAGHISNFAILIMMPMPPSSIADGDPRQDEPANIGEQRRDVGRRGHASG